MQKHFMKQLIPQSLSTVLSLNLKKAAQDWGSALKSITSARWEWTQPFFLVMGVLTPLTSVEMWQNCDPEMQLKTTSKYPGMFSQTVNLRKENVNILLTVGEYGKKNQFLQDSLLGKQYSFLDLL